ncbi:Bys1 family protein [Verticillium dahliae VdLs.17]|uniref:Bys1 family protein n=1 Tax=Verticillium dahliae (strain VdLs.17 / ATCC MYA-4575 / FGSC 10137) TaxID=498257 RepID=G2WXC2_VERDV|nr:Bys1 family protein [Verticillium dahliae VdLs.17]EGY21377.1 Bys1 family protein [Verticillium dahliae VdLs.17]
MDSLVPWNLRAEGVVATSGRISVWSVGSAIAGPYRLAPKSGSYAGPFVKDPKTGGKAIKITTARDGLYTGAPQLNFAYSLDGSKVWYDLSSVFGDAFKGKKLVEKSADSTCPAITWANGTPPASSQVKTCTSAKDVTLTLCACARREDG